MPNVDAPGGPGLTDSKADCCKRTNDKKKEQQGENSAWSQSGIIDEHQSILQEIANDLKIVMYFRKTKGECQQWIREKHMPKPSTVHSGTTILGAGVADTRDWLKRFFDGMSPEAAQTYPKSWSVHSSSQYYGRIPAEYIGIIGSTKAGKSKGEPLRGSGKFRDKWMTGDYDLFQVVYHRSGCIPVAQEGEHFARVKREVNKRLKWPAVQHGPQAQWVPPQSPISMPDAVKKSLRSGGDPAVQFDKYRKPMKVLDRPLTVVAGKGVTKLENLEEVKDALICEGCAE